MISQGTGLGDRFVSRSQYQNIKKTPNWRRREFLPAKDVNTMDMA